ncbi:hypothetical protein BN381_100108 [Candidatus Microthrix parvicella RN1]|uniref:Uncharacterized protein n=1 Tax=Candidatus Neomicrothrix parvicella RN1 TaxID=1229780 RepID=R4YYZ7_9ACTN|nr:hypothetical protein BN381_100108 [Candidatus Microthrix parvicella RN1]
MRAMLVVARQVREPLQEGRVRNTAEVGPHVGDRPKFFGALGSLPVTARHLVATMAPRRARRSLGDDT